MAKALISSILQSQLGKYVDGLSPDSLQVGLWSGELLLTNLRLKPNALAELNLPIQVVQGSIAKIHVVVPWNQLGSSSVQITLEGIFGVAVPNSELPSQEEVLIGIRNRLERAELLRQHQMHENNAKDEESFFSRLTSRIMDNLVITIRDFHLRYEDSASNPNRPFTCGILMESFTIETTDSDGKKKIFVDRSASPVTKTHKVAKLKNLAVYWDHLTPTTKFEKSTSFEHNMRKIIYSDFRQLDKRWLIVPPCSLTVRYIKNESRVFTKEAPKYRIQTTVENLSFHLSREQYDEMIFMYKALMGRMAVEAHFWYNRHRPFLSISNYSIVWWDYAVRFYSKKKRLRFRWSVVRKMARDRKMYVALYKQHHLQKNTLKMEQVAYLQKLEDTFPVELVMRLREIGEEQFESAKSAAAQSTQTWYGYFFGEESKSDVLSDEGKADLKKAFEETVALEEIQVPEDCSILIVELDLKQGETALYSYGNKRLLTCFFQGSLYFQVQPSDRWTFQLQLQQLNVLNWRTESTPSHMFCTLQSPEESIVPFDFSIGVINATTMRFQLSAEPLRIILDAVFILQLCEFFQTNDSAWNDVWAYATSSVQNYVFAEQEADMRAVVAKGKEMKYDVLIDMKAPVVFLPEDASSTLTPMVLLDFGRFSLKDIPPSSSHVRSWQIDMTEIEVLYQPVSRNEVSLIPQFNLGFSVDTIKNKVTGIPVVVARATLPSLAVNVSKETIIDLGRLHTSLLTQCKPYFKSQPFDDEILQPIENQVTPSLTKETCSIQFFWNIDDVHINFAEAFSLILSGTSFKYEAWSTYSVLLANLKDLSMEDKCYSPTSPYFYLAKTDGSGDLIQVKVKSSTSSTREADTLVDVNFNVLSVQWNPSSISQLYTMVSSYGTIDSSFPTNLQQSTSLTVSSIPRMKLSASLRKFDISFNKDLLDRRLLTLSITDASLVYIAHDENSYEIKGDLGDVTGVDFSFEKSAIYAPFFGLDSTQLGAKKLLEFSYEMNSTATLSIVLSAIRIVYFHQQILELVDYFLQGILGTLVNQTLMSATQMLLEPATVTLNVCIDKPKILIPTNPSDPKHFLLVSSSLQLTHDPSGLVEYSGSRFETVTDNGFRADKKRVVLEHAGLLSSNSNGGYDNLLGKPLALDISIIDIMTNYHVYQGKPLPRFSIDCHMPHMHLNISRQHYLMFFEMLSENIGGETLGSSVEPLQANNATNRPVVVYEYANTDLEAATMVLSFLMESFSCSLDIGVVLETNNLVVCVNSMNDVNPSVDISLSNITVSQLIESDTMITLKYEWSDKLKSSSMHVTMANLHGKMVPHVLQEIAQFFSIADSNSTKTVQQELEATSAEGQSFSMAIVAQNVQLSFPRDLGQSNGLEFVVGANFGIMYESLPNNPDNMRQKLTLEASECEALLRNANRQGCSDTLVQLIEPTILSVTYQGFVPYAGHHQERIDVSISPIEVYLSYEDTQVLTEVFSTMQNDMKAGADEPSQTVASSVAPVNATNVEVQRHVTCDIKRMQLTLINDCDGCDMGLLQLELPTCRTFVNATSNNDVTTATGGGDISFAASYYNPDSRIWHSLCPEWKLNATVMTNISHSSKSDQMNSMQWTITADKLKFTVTHGLLEALASAGGTLMKSKHSDIASGAPCTIKNETGMPIEYWWSSEPTRIIRVENTLSSDIRYVHVKGQGSGVTRKYTSNARDNDTLCVDLIGMDSQPVRGIVVEQLGARPFALVENRGSLSKLSVTCDTQLAGGHIVLTISSHLRVQSHLSNEIQLLVYDPTWPAPVEIGNLKLFETTAIPVAYSNGSELRVRFSGSDWAYSSPIPIDATNSSTISVTSTNASQVAVFCVALNKGLIELYEPYVLENKLPVSIVYQVKDSQSLPKGDDVVVGCKSAIWWCKSTPMFAFKVPGCETTNWLPLLRKRESSTFSLVLKRVDKQQMTILVSLSENDAKSITITLLADIWIINKTGLNLIYGNEAEDIYIPEARSVIGNTDITLYSTSSLLRFKMTAASSWTTRFKPDPRRMNWQDECLTLTNQGRLYEFGVSADYATRHFGVLTTLVSITPRYVIVNRTQWTLIFLEDDGNLHTIEDVHHIVNACDAYSLYWNEGKRRSLRASVVGINGTSSWSESFSINAPNTFDLIIPNDVYCPFLQVSVKTGGLTQATFVIDIIRMDTEPDFEQSKWDVIGYDIKVAGLDVTLTDSLKSDPAFELFRGEQSENVARFSISNIRFDSFKDRTSTHSHLQIGAINLDDLLKDSKFPKVLTPAKGGDFVQFTYVSKRHPKYAYIEQLTLNVKDVRLQTSMKFVDRINKVMAEVSSHFKGKEVDLLTYFTAFDSMEMSAITGRKTFFEQCQISPIRVVVSFIREKDDRIDPSAGFWLSNLKFRIKDASLVLEAYKLNNAFATKESVVQSMGAFYESSLKGQALNLIESIQVTSLVTGVVKDGVSSLVSTLIGKTDSSLASSSFRYESLSNQSIVQKHSNALQSCTSSSGFPNILNHLVYDWDSNHTGLEARACVALGIMNNSRQSIVLQTYLKDGAEIRLLPGGRSHLDASRSNWTSDRALIVFAWGYTPSLLTTGDICFQIQSNAFNLYISKNSTRLQPNPGYSATFTVQEKQSWWSKYMVIVGDDLHSQDTTETAVSNNTYEILFTTDALGIVAKQEDYQTVVVRECCYFSNGEPGPALATGKISEGDTILSVNGIPIKSTQAFKEVIVSTPRPVVVRFKKAAYDLFGEAPPAAQDHEYSLFG